MRGIELGNLFLSPLAILKHDFVFAYKMCPFYIDISSLSKKNFRMLEQDIRQKLQINRNISKRTLGQNSQGRKIVLIQDTRSGDKMET